jgi:ketosteroid isomerase-like protein
MFDPLFEYRVTIYLILAVAAVILIALWFRDRRRGWLYGLGVVALLAGVFFLLDLTIETPSKQIKRKLQQMAQGVRNKDAKAIFAHVSDQFAWEDANNMNKAEFQRRVDRLLQSGLVTDLVIWDEKFPDDSGKVVFMAKPKGPGIPDGGDKYVFRVRATFVRDPDKQWRLKSFTTHNPLNDDRYEVGKYLP